MEVAQFRQGKEEVPAHVDLGFLVEEAEGRGRIVVKGVGEVVALEHHAGGDARYPLVEGVDSILPV